MLTTTLITFLAAYGLAYAYINFPLLEPIRKLVAKYISAKLNECYICASFWLTLFVIIPCFICLSGFLFYTFLLLPFSVTGLAVIVTHVLTKRDS